MKVLFNMCYGGFGYSTEFEEEFAKQFPDKKFKMHWRSDPDTVALVEKMGSKKASGYGCHIGIEEIPDNVEFTIDDYDGAETVHWELPMNEIIDDLLDVLKGRAPLDQTNTFTQWLVQKDATTFELRSKLTLEISGKKTEETI